MQITQDEVLALLGAKEVEIYLLKKQIATIENLLKKAEKPEENAETV
jgi:hypothetical protein